MTSSSPRMDGAAAGSLAGRSGGLSEREIMEQFATYRRAHTETAVAVAVIRTLTAVVETSTELTMMGLESDLKAAGEVLSGSQHASISLRAACELFMRYVSKANYDMPDFEQCKSVLIQRGVKFAELSLAARARIAALGAGFVRNGGTVLVHGKSRCVEGILRRAAEHGKRFHVLVTEGRPGCPGREAAESLARQTGMHVTVIVDAAAAHFMQEVSVVMVGAEGVVENGGTVNLVGTLGVALAAKAFGVPVYAAAESYKFARLYPLTQADVRDAAWSSAGGPPSPSSSTSASASAPSASALSVAGRNGGVLEFRVRHPEWSVLRADDAQGGSGGGGGAKGGGSDPFGGPLAGLGTLSPGVATANPKVDYTPPELITLLITDLGVLTSSAVSDELIKLYF